jgi:hypothetical protein
MDHKYKVMKAGGMKLAQILADKNDMKLVPKNQYGGTSMGHGGVHRMPGGGMSSDMTMDMLKAKAMEMGGMSPDAPESKQAALVKLAQSMSREDATMLAQILNEMLGAEQRGGGMM